MTTPPHPAQPNQAQGAPYGPPAAAYPAGQPYAPAGYPQGGYLPNHPPAVPGCRLCGAQHVENIAVRAHQGFLLFMRFHRFDGPFCRSCGRAMVREMTSKTLWQGWWSPFSLVAFTPFTLLWNLVAHLKFSKLPQSVPAPGRQSLPEGTPVLRRPLAYVALIPAAWAVWVITGIITHAG